ncbi:MAG: hypothetical protein D6732_14935 [Methanobacteriota archaeon]|nr:MAG: hypothetical protein D6732_14935 [Euryarchaeota archaeon]
MFSPAAIFLKFDKLYQHIKSTEYLIGTKLKKPVSGLTAVGVPFGLFIAGIFLLFIVPPLALVVWVAIPVIWIYVEAQWQEAMNAHIDFHFPNYH